MSRFFITFAHFFVWKRVGDEIVNKNKTVYPESNSEHCERSNNE